jgi:hypothetical protein
MHTNVKNVSRITNQIKVYSFISKQHIHPLKKDTNVTSVKNAILQNGNLIDRK